MVKGSHDLQGKHGMHPFPKTSMLLSSYDQGHSVHVKHDL